MLYLKFLKDILSALIQLHPLLLECLDVTVEGGYPFMQDLHLVVHLVDVVEEGEVDVLESDVEPQFCVETFPVVLGQD